MHVLPEHPAAAITVTQRASPISRHFQVTKEAVEPTSPKSPKSPTEHEVTYPYVDPWTGDKYYKNFVVTPGGTIYGDPPKKRPRVRSNDDAKNP